MLAGGEPTLHRELLPIVRFLGTHCRNVVIFTNGLRLADPDFARAAVEAGITRFEIALFGASAECHDAVTQVRGSFERTLVALNTLAALRGEYEFAIEVRLLVSRQSSPRNPAIVRLVHERAPGIDAISLNRLILSESAQDVEATISWEEARPSINESARLIREFGYELRYEALPLCLFDGDNAAFIRERTTRKLARIAAGLEPRTWQFRYFDPVLAAGRTLGRTSLVPVALPDLCVRCDYFSVCARVEEWYVRRYGLAGLRPVQAAVPLGEGR
jgi:MoaA/NifB/PqqE/SkfB family radical SAM enzyme